MEGRVSPDWLRHYLGGQGAEICHEPRWRWNVLNRYGGPAPKGGEAEVTYLDGDFHIVRPGAFVRCAVTGVPIPLEELKYWNVDLQEAYATPEAVLERHHKK